MIVAFEGIEGIGISTLANNVTVTKKSPYRISEEPYKELVKSFNPRSNMIMALDRIGWVSDLAYRLTLFDYSWGEGTKADVFFMPDTHLVFKVASPEYLERHYSFGEEGSPEVAQLSERLNTTYLGIAHFLSVLNVKSAYQLFRSISIIEVDGDKKEHLISFTSPRRALERLGLDWDNSGGCWITTPKLLQVLEGEEAIR